MSPNIKIEARKANGVRGQFLRVNISMHQTNRVTQGQVTQNLLSPLLLYFLAQYVLIIVA